MIVFFGSVFVDIIANVDKDFLQKYHLKPDEAIRATPEIEEVFQEVKKFNPILQPGGSIFNSARLFQWVSRKSYPLVITGAAVGLEQYGEIIKSKLIEEEICCDLIESPEVRTGIVAVLLTAQMRTMVTHHGASREFFTMHLEGNLWKRLQEAEYFYFSALSIRTCFDIISKACQYLNEKKKIIVMNLGASILSAKYPLEIKYLVDNCDILFGNENEYKALYNIDNVTDTFDQKLFEKLIKICPKKPSKLMVMTRGNQSVQVFENGKHQEFDVLPIPTDKIIDTNGAGDAFVAGFLAQYVKNKDILDCVKCGLWTSREIIQQHGCNFDKNKLYKF